MANITINQESLKPRREFKRHPVQPGHNIFRILPPFGDEEVHNNYPYKRWVLAWLLDPRSNKRKPFALPQYDKDNPDPVSQYVKMLTEKIDRVKKSTIDSMISKGVALDKAESVVKEKLVDANKLIWELRPKAGFFYNACNKSGEIGILELKKTAHDALKAEMYQYIKDYSQDPTSLNGENDDSGVWFDVERVGEKGDKDTEYKVRKHQTKHKNEQGKLIFEDDRETLPEHVMQNYSDMGYDIYGLYQVKTNEELYAILMFNLKDIVDKVPVARLDGFDPDQFDFTAVEVEEPAKPVVSSVVKGKAPVKIALQDSADDIDVDLSISEDIIRPTTSTKKVDALTDSNILAIADEFLNS